MRVRRARPFRSSSAHIKLIISAYNRELHRVGDKVTPSRSPVTAEKLRKAQTDLLEAQTAALKLLTRLIPDLPQYPRGTPMDTLIAGLDEPRRTAARDLMATLGMDDLRAAARRA
jgi:hypothetical protein